MTEALPLASSVAAPADTDRALPARRPLDRAFAFRGSLRRSTSVLIGAFACAAVVGTWELSGTLGWSDPNFLPSPARVLGTMVEMTLGGQMIGNAAISVARVWAAFLLSATMAIPIGILMGAYRPIAAALEPVVDFIRYLPVPALVPLSIIWFGIGEETKIFLLWLGTFFQLVLLVVDDMERVPQEYVEIARTVGARTSQVLTDVAFRAMLPGLVNNLRITLGWCWTYLIIAEIVAADSGLGFVIWTARRFMQTSQVMAGIIAIGLIGLATDQLLRALHRRLFRYL